MHGGGRNMKKARAQVCGCGAIMPSPHVDHSVFFVVAQGATTRSMLAMTRSLGLSVVALGRL